MKPVSLAVFGLFVLISGASATAATAPAPRPPRIEAGTYRQIDTVTKQPLAVGNQIVIMAGKAGKLAFSINAVRQADMNQGFVVGLLPATLPGTWSQSATSGNCRLSFEALPKGLKVVQDAGFGDCGFGAGVTASGTYALRPEKP